MKIVAPVYVAVFGAAEAMAQLVAGGVLEGPDAATECRQGDVGWVVQASADVLEIGTVALCVATLRQHLKSITLWDLVADPSGAVPLLFVAIAFIQALEFLNGFDSPNKGTEFHDGGTTLSADVTGQLLHAAPTEWSGAGARRYADKNLDQQDLVKRLADADRSIVDILKGQAFQVELGRDTLAAIRLGLVAAVPYAVCLYAQWYNLRAAYIDQSGTPTERKARSTRPMYKAEASLLDYVRRVVLVAGLAALALITYLIVEGNQNSRDIGSVSRKYRSIADDVAGQLADGQTLAGPAPTPTW